MRNIQTLIQATKGSQRSNPAAHTNRAGAPSFRRSLREQTVQVLTTGTLGNAFYASGSQLAKEAVEMLTQCRNTAPEFLARSLIWAREHGMMKTLPIFGLTVLSGGHGRTKALFTAAFPRVIRTPDDLRSFVALCRTGTVPGRKGLGGMARRVGSAPAGPRPRGKAAVRGRGAVAPSGEKGVRFVYGWSESVLKYIALDLESGASQVTEIEQMGLGPRG